MKTDAILQMMWNKKMLNNQTLQSSNSATVDYRWYPRASEWRLLPLELLDNRSQKMKQLLADKATDTSSVAS